MAAADNLSGRFPKTVAAIGGFVFLTFGVWAISAPQSFFDRVASFEPFNQHFVQDLGAFQIGLGVTLLLAAFLATDALVVALIGTGIGAVAHVGSHLAGIDLGGTPGFDIPALSVLGVLLLVAGTIRWRSLRQN